MQMLNNRSHPIQPKSSACYINSKLTQSQNPSSACYCLLQVFNSFLFTIMFWRSETTWLKLLNFTQHKYNTINSLLVYCMIQNTFKKIIKDINCNTVCFITEYIKWNVKLQSLRSIWRKGNAIAHNTVNSCGASVLFCWCVFNFHSALCTLVLFYSTTLFSVYTTPWWRWSFLGWSWVV